MLTLTDLRGNLNETNARSMRTGPFHVAEALTKGDHLEAVALHLGRQLSRVPACVKGRTWRELGRFRGYQRRSRLRFTIPTTAMCDQRPRPFFVGTPRRVNSSAMLR